MGNPLLKIFQKKDASYAFVDLLNFEHYEEFEEGIIKCKDGSFMLGWSYTGIDYESASTEELNYLSTRLNDILRNQEAGWAMWTEALRLETDDYPAESDCHFPDQTSSMIDQERRKAVKEQDAHYETVCFIVLMYKSPPKLSQKVMAAMIEEDEEGSGMSLEERSYRYFKNRLQQFENSYSTIFPIKRLKPYKEVDGNYYCNFLRLLHYCATGIMRYIRIPDPRIPVDCLIAGQDFYPSFTPLIGDQYVGIVSVEGVQAFTTPAMLAIFDQMPLRYRWSTRFIFQNRHDSMNALGAHRRKWNQKVVGFKDQLIQNPNPIVNIDAKRMVDDADEATADVSSGEVNHGFYTSVFVLYSENLDQLNEATDYFKQRLNDLGFGGRVERQNATQAFLGSIPGNVYPNITKPTISTANLSDLLPVASAWPGAEHAPCPFYPKYAPALLQAETIGSTPFRLNLHVNDIGHTFIVGTTGTGKSTLLALLAAQFLKYKEAQIFAFDKGCSMFAICKGCDGNHFDIGSADTEGNSAHQFKPFNELNNQSDMAWASNWAENCMVLQGLVMTPGMRREIGDALQRLVASPNRTITEFVANLQDVDMREAMMYYTIDGTAGHLVDGEHDSADFVNFNVFEVGELMSMGDKIILPVILYLFRRIEKSLTGVPTIIILDEVWLLLEHPVFREMVREWLKVLRKANAAVVMATQSVSDAERSGIIDVIVDSCATKILLPHPSIAEETHRHFYANTLGMNPREIELLSRATPKKQYYYTSSMGKRLFELNLRPKTLAFVGTSSPQDLAELRTTIAQHPETWRDEWLERCLNG